MLRSAGTCPSKSTNQLMDPFLKRHTIDFEKPWKPFRKYKASHRTVIIVFRALFKYPNMQVGVSVCI